MSGNCKDSCQDVEGLDRNALRKVLAINVAQSVAGGIVGVWASSTALLGAAVDNLADAGVYGLGLYAVGRRAELKARAARISGWILVALSASLLFEVVRRFITGAEPIGLAMMGMAAVNAALNLVCLRILRNRGSSDVNFKASMIFTNNDTQINLGIVLSGALVMFMQSPVPDLIIGLLVAGLAFRGGCEILREASAVAGASG